MFTFEIAARISISQRPHETRECEIKSNQIKSNIYLLSVIHVHITLALMSYCTDKIKHIKQEDIVQGMGV